MFKSEEDFKKSQWLVDRTDQEKILRNVIGFSFGTLILLGSFLYKSIAIILGY